MASRQWSPPGARRIAVGIPSRTRESGTKTQRTLDSRGRQESPSRRSRNQVLTWEQKHWARPPPAALSRSALRLIRKLLPFPLQVALELMDLQLRKVSGPTGNDAAPIIPDPAAGWSVVAECPTPPGGIAEWYTTTTLANCSALQNAQTNGCLAGQNITGLFAWPPTVGSPGTSGNRCILKLVQTSSATNSGVRVINWGRPNTGPYTYINENNDAGGNNQEHESQPDNDTVPSWLRPVAPNIEPNNRPGAPAPTAPPEWARPNINDPKVIPPEWREVGPEPNVPVGRPRLSPGAVAVPTPTGPVIWRPGWPFNVPRPKGPATQRPRPQVPDPVRPPDPAPEPKPDPALAPREPVVSVIVGTRRPPRAIKEQHWQQRPKPGQREVKPRYDKRTTYQVVDALMNAVTEGTDFLEAIHDAICDGQKGKSKKPQDLLKDLWDAVQRDAIDWRAAARNIVYEQVMDAVIGKIAKSTGEAHRMAQQHLGGAISPVGIQSRLNAAQKPIGHGQPIGEVQAWIRQADKYGGRSKASRPQCKNQQRIL